MRFHGKARCTEVHLVNVESQAESVMTQAPATSPAERIRSRETDLRDAMGAVDGFEIGERNREAAIELKWAPIARPVGDASELPMNFDWIFDSLEFGERG